MATPGLLKTTVFWNKGYEDIIPAHGVTNKILSREWNHIVLGTNLIFYNDVAKGLKLKVRKFWGLIPMFVEVAGEKVVGGGGDLYPE